MLSPLKQSSEGSLQPQFFNRRLLHFQQRKRGLLNRFSRFQRNFFRMANKRPHPPLPPLGPRLSSPRNKETPVLIRHGLCVLHKGRKWHNRNYIGFRPIHVQPLIPPCDYHKHNIGLVCKVMDWGQKASYFLRLYSILFRNSRIEKMGCSFSPEDKEAKIDEGRRGRLSTVDCRKKSTKVLDVILENVTMIS